MHETAKFLESNLTWTCFSQTVNILFQIKLSANCLYLTCRLSCHILEFFFAVRLTLIMLLVFDLLLQFVVFTLNSNFVLCFYLVSIKKSSAYITHKLWPSDWLNF